mgnify:CR=1 FL=1
MRTLTITRKKSFIGAIIPYYCIIGVNKDNINDDDTQYAIKNGETISVSMSEEKFCIVVAANTSSGLVVMPPFLVEKGNDDVSLELVTKYNLTKGSTFELLKK